MGNGSCHSPREQCPCGYGEGSMTKWVEAFRREEIRQEARSDAAGRYDRDEPGTMAYHVKLYKLGLRGETAETTTARKKTPRGRLLPWVVGLVVLLLPAIGTAQDPSVLAPEPPVRTVTGTVVSASDGALVITTEVGIEQSFSSDEQSTIAAGLAPGQLVTVRYRALPHGRFYAARVTFGDPGTTDEPPTTQAAGRSSDAAGPPPSGRSNTLPLILGV